MKKSPMLSLQMYVSKKVTFKWSRVDEGLLRSGFCPDSQNITLTSQR